METKIEYVGMGTKTDSTKFEVLKTVWVNNNTIIQLYLRSMKDA